MIYKIFADSDNFLTNLVKLGIPQTGSNFGQSEILELYKKAGLSGSSGYYSSASLSRILIKFDLNSISQLTSSAVAPSTGVKYYLKLSNAQHTTTIPTNFYVDIYPVSSSWVEGSGIDNDEYLDHDESNWVKSNTNSYWVNQGGDYVTTISSSYLLTTGFEDLNVEVTNIVNAWLTGGLPNHGFMIKLTQAEETDTLDYYVKKFHARNTHYLDKQPALEAKWDDSIRDDRGYFVFNTSNTLFLYNKIKGQLQNISGVGTGQNVLTVKIQDLSGTLSTVSASHTGMTGIYSASFTLNSGSYSGSIFYDKWSYAGVSYLTGVFYPITENTFSSNQQKTYQAKVTNIKPEYSQDEKVRFNVFIKTNGYNPAVYSTGSLVLKNTIINKAYYKIENALTNKTIVELGTGSIETTRLSYDENGNYFNLYMNTFPKNEVYKIVLFVDNDGQFQKLSNEFRFKVV